MPVNLDRAEIFQLLQQPDMMTACKAFFQIHSCYPGAKSLWSHSCNQTCPGPTGGTLASAKHTHLCCHT